MIIFVQLFIKVQRVEPFSPVYFGDGVPRMEMVFAVVVL